MWASLRPPPAGKKLNAGSSVVPRSALEGVAKPERPAGDPPRGRPVLGEVKRFISYCGTKNKEKIMFDYFQAIS
jgi:hypothetical protein